MFDRSKLKLYPEDPGVYIMKGGFGKVLYIGKAINIRARLNQYFHEGGDGREMVSYLVPKIETIETITVSSEKEALLLENNLIKKHKPPYNVFLKDDKSYLALKITKSHPYPMILLTRYKGVPQKDGLYFGPYTSAKSARSVFELINKVFPLRQCSDEEFKRRTRPCILYDMGRCIAPCVSLCTKEEYQEIVEKCIRFLRGKSKEVVSDLTKKMEAYSESLAFEKAAVIKNLLKDVRSIVEEQFVDRVHGKDRDVFGLYREGSLVSLCKLIIRKGKLESKETMYFQDVLQESSTVLASLLMQTYFEEKKQTIEVLLPIPIPEEKELGELLKPSVKLIVPQRGESRALVEMSSKNAKESFERFKAERDSQDKVLQKMQETFRLKNFPATIECFDTSHLAGSNFVATMVVFKEGKKAPRHYRKYRVKEAKSQDDYGAMREVLTRRLKRAKEEMILPDLIVIDGGKGHLNCALKVLDALNIIAVDVIGVAKESGRHDKGLTKEQVFLKDVKDPILLRQNDPLLFFLQKVRDEAHRTAISYQKNRRKKGVSQSVLDEIEGIGPKRKKTLIKHFGSPKKVLEATEEELIKVPGIPPSLAKTIFRFAKNP